jgi:hypothetical protein
VNRELRDPVKKGEIKHPDGNQLFGDFCRIVQFLAIYSIFGCISICRISKSKDILFERTKMFCSGGQRWFVRADKGGLFRRTKVVCSGGQRWFVQ